MSTEIKNRAITFEPVDKDALVALAKAVEASARAVEASARAVEAITNMAKPVSNQYGFYISDDED